MEEQNNLINLLITAGIEKQEAQKELSILVKEFGANNSEKIQALINKRIKTREPIQYLLKKAYFMDFEVRVNKNVLIPRPETEILVEETIKKCRGVSRNALDIGTGSGIIAIALARLVPNIKITAIDISQEVIDLAKENARNCGVLDKIDFQVCDLFSSKIEDIFKPKKVDLIISNPPYIKEENWHKLSPEVNRHEPKIALTGSQENKTGLVYYERIIELVKKHRATGLIALEIDPPLVNDLKLLLKKLDLNNYKIIKDYAELERGLLVSL